MTSSRALTLLAAGAAPVFMAAAVAGWLTGSWPATPGTLALSAALMLGGPLLGVFHAATAGGPRSVAPAPRRDPPPAPEPVLPQVAAARAFHDWRDTPVAAIAQRDRDRRFRANRVRA